MKFELVRPEAIHQAQYEAMMDEWEAFGGRLNPGALRRFSHKWQRKVSYAQWLAWIQEDRETTQDLYFFLGDGNLLGAISIRTGNNIGIDGHAGYGIRPSQRGKGYATKMLELALDVMRKKGINPVILSCAPDNEASASVMIHNGAVFLRNAVEEDTGETVKVYQITL